MTADSATPSREGRISRPSERLGARPQTGLASLLLLHNRVGHVVAASARLLLHHHRQARGAAPLNLASSFLPVWIRPLVRPHACGSCYDKADLERVMAGGMEVAAATSAAGG